MGLVITFILGLFVLAGAAIAAFAKDEERIREISIAVALGAMVMLLVGDLVPEVAEKGAELGGPFIIAGVALGVVILVALDRFLPEEHHHAEGPNHQDTDSVLHISVATAIALVIHNIVEGMGVFSVSVADPVLATILGVGIGVHNIPMGMIVSAGIRGETTFHKAVLLAAAALSTFIGGLVMFALSSALDERVVTFMICLTIGLLGYIIVFELAPHVLHSKNPKLVVPCVLIGVAAVLVSGLLEGLA